MKLLPFKLVCIVLALLISFISHAQIKVACVGNSITAGSRLNGDSTYPQQLQQLLGTEYLVRNFGRSGRTVQRYIQDTYWTTEEYAKVLEWKPDIVIIKLGTNDAKTNGNWQGESVFYNDYMAFVNSFKQLASKPKIYVCFPIPVFLDGQYDISENVMKRHIIPTIKRVAKKQDLNLIDLYTPMYGRMDLIYKPHDKDDLIHPNGKGAKFIAQEIYKVLIY